MVPILQTTAKKNGRIIMVPNLQTTAKKNGRQGKPCWPSNLARY
jgi:hypothetical protein